MKTKRRRRYVRKRGVNRNFDDPAYKKWRKDVYARDGYKCQLGLPNCKRDKRLQAHHIKTWSKYPSLRLEVNNGITLCSECHNHIKGQEDSFISLFMKIVLRNR